jgi:hypothetical protein
MLAVQRFYMLAVADGGDCGPTRLLVVWSQGIFSAALFDMHINRKAALSGGFVGRMKN